MTTAQQARCYKPGQEIFHIALKKASVMPDQIVHVGQSIYHDVIPARSLGMTSVWVNRPSPRPGSGAAKSASAQPDLEVPNLKTLAELTENREL